VRTPRGSVWSAVALTAVLLAGFVGVRLVTHGGPGAFPAAGDRFVDATAPDDLVVNAHSTGYDGQFVYRLGLDPLTRVVTDSGITLDTPAYRAQRVVLPALAWFVDRLPGVPLSLALILVNLVALLVAAGAAALLARDLGRSPWWGCAVGLAPPLVISLARDLTECTALALLLVGLVLWRRGRLGWAAVAFTVAVLARESVLTVLAGMGLWQVYVVARRGDGDRRAVLRGAVLLVPLAGYLGWQAWLAHRWGEWPSAAGGPSPGLPIIAPVASVLDGAGDLLALDRAHVLAHIWVVERLLLLSFVIVVALALRASRLDPDIKTGAAVALLVPLTLDWHADVQFLRASAEAVVLGTLVLLGTEPLRLRRAVLVVPAWAALVGAVYAVSL
jgi:hypothetical protein